MLTVRTVSAEYLIAMKLKSAREYKNDLSDILGILNEHEENGSPISLQMIENAVINLYGSWDSLPQESMKFIRDIIRKGDYASRFVIVNEKEKQMRELLVEFDNKYPKAMKESNLKEILNVVMKKLSEEENK